LQKLKSKDQLENVAEKQGSNYILTRGLIAKVQNSEDQIERSLWNGKTESFWEATVRSSSSSATAPPFCPLNAAPHAITADRYNADRPLAL
jgi:hypothetical protein